jgi:hypothetical protein
MMSPDFSQTLWSNPGRSRFFLIPDDRQLPGGDFVLRTIIGRQMEVEETALAPFEVSREQAKDRLKEQFGQMLTTAKGGIMDALKSWRSPQTQQKSGSDHLNAMYEGASDSNSEGLHQAQAAARNLRTTLEE